MRLRKSTCPTASAPCNWNTFFAMSKPIVVACSMDASFGGSLTPSPWHADAVGGRPPHHPDREHAYVLDELASSITVFDYDPARAAFIWKQTISTLPADFAGTNTT